MRTPHEKLCTSELRTSDEHDEPLTHKDITSRFGLSEEAAVVSETQPDDRIYLSDERPHLLHFSSSPLSYTPRCTAALHITTRGVRVYYYPERNISFVVHPVGNMCYPTDKARVGVFIVCFSSTVAKGFNLSRGFNFFSTLSPKEVALARDISTYEALIYA